MDVNRRKYQKVTKICDVFLFGKLYKKSKQIDAFSSKERFCGKIGIFFE